MKPLAQLLTAGVVFSCLISSTHADRKSRLEEKARQERVAQQRQRVEYILQQENAGQLTDRKQALKELIASGDAPDEAYWQAGYIKKGDEWVSVGDRWLTPEQEQKLAEYTKARSDSVDSDEGHYKLAQWCVENGFQGQAYGHLMAVLLNNPDHAGLRQLLGYQQIGNRWINAEDYNALVREADRLAKELQEWGPKVAKLCEGLNSPITQDQIVARNQLKQITHPAAISALELILLPSSDNAAAACVDQLCEIDHRRSSIALCKAALFLPDTSSATKQAAIEELKTRPLDDFAPLLLRKMQTPLTAQFASYNEFASEFSHGPFCAPRMYRHQQIRYFGEARLSNKSIDELRTTSLRILVSDIHLHRFGAGGLELSNGIANGQQIIDMRNELAGQRDVKSMNIKMDEATRDAHLAVIRLNRFVEQQNDDISRMNESLVELMGLINDESIYESPEYWWAWWRKRIEVESNRKLVKNQVEVNESKPVHMLMVSCFTAGTPVWTDLGPRPIEQLHVGDMALTQDIETGELMYRPIIRTTTRKPKPLVTIDLGAEQIVSTGGHPFFVVGEGWVRARELKADQVLRTPTGTIKIESLTETPEDKTYNLVVDGFHTYFVGMSQALVHDVSITSPSDAVVPGLLDR